MPLDPDFLEFCSASVFSNRQWRLSYPLCTFSWYSMWFFLSSYSFFDRFCFFRFDSISLRSNTLFSVSGRKKETKNAMT